jgi:3-oxosteroid 1-dehydrogenase
MTYLDATVGQSDDAPAATRERLATYVTEAARMVDFLVDQGVKLRRFKYYPDYYDDRPGGVAPGRTVTAEIFDASELGPWRERLRPAFLQLGAALDEARELPHYKRSWRARYVMMKVGLRTALAKLTGKHWVTAGAALQGRMLQAALKAGVDVRTDVPVNTFIVEDGAVKGVVTLKDGREWRIGARLGVLVNAGGFGHNQQMRDKYMPDTSAKWCGAAPGDTGEMLQELMKLGAAVAQMDEQVGNQMSIPPGRENTGDGVALSRVGVFQQIAKPHSILVDQTGVRYQREAGSYHEFCQRMRQRNREVPAIPSWWIVDEQYMQNYMFADVLPGMPKPRDWYDLGYLKRADSIEELAALCSIDPNSLKSTIERFNAGARAGRDPDLHRGERAFDNYIGDPFHTPSQALGPIDKPPFYAAAVVPADLGTFGGVMTDAHARVLLEDGTPIEGLYATGTTTASVMGRYYPGPGASVGPSFTWGFVAAKHASGLSNQ